MPNVDKDQNSLKDLNSLQFVFTKLDKNPTKGGFEQDLLGAINTKK